MVVADPSELSNWKDFWSNFAIGFILDYIKFSCGHLQHIINATWRIRDSVSIVGRDSYFYLLHFDHLDELNHICIEFPWSIDGALFVLEKWRPNLILSRLQLNYVSLWVQLHGLPLKYQYPKLVEKIGQLMGIFERVDWEDRLPRNIRFIRIRVHTNPWSPLIAGFMLRLDDGSKFWIQCKYERIHKLCNWCGLIGHNKGQCTCSVDDIEMMLFRQRVCIQRLH